MALLEGSKETFLSRLQHTAVKSGTYLVMPQWTGEWDQYCVTFFSLRRHLFETRNWKHVTLRAL